MGFLTTFTFRHHHLNWLFFIVRQMDQEQVAEQPLPDPPESTPANDGEEEEILSSEPMFTSPPAVYIEPEAPDPFLIDEEGDEASEGEEPQDSSAAASQYTVSPAHNVPLDLSQSPSPDPSSRQPPPVSPRPNIYKDVPPPPSEESEPDEEEVPDLYVPALVVPTMFLPIPNVRRLF